MRPSTPFVLVSLVALLGGCPLAVDDLYEFTEQAGVAEAGAAVADAAVADAAVADAAVADAAVGDAAVDALRLSGDDAAAQTQEWSTASDAGTSPCSQRKDCRNEGPCESPSCDEGASND